MNGTTKATETQARRANAKEWAGTLTDRELHGLAEGTIEGPRDAYRAISLAAVHAEIGRRAATR